MKLEIVIPALNEEQSIKSIIKKCLESKKQIIDQTEVTDVSITVVSDGSTDNTVKYAQEFEKEINLIIFKKNKGYGAAIKKGWSESNADLLSFLDADGTCNPLFFIELVELITKQGADIALGCRLNKNSQMPLTRRIGNTIFSLMLSFFASQKVKDTASGMRVIKSSIIDQIYPLPDGLHFTPAMSAKAVTNPEINIMEKDMSYKEREGVSKLNVIKDGLRFFNIITKLSFMYRPEVILSTFALFLLTTSILLMADPIYFYLKNFIILDSSIYRFIFSGLLLTISTSLFCVSFLSSKIVKVSLLKDHNTKTKKGLSYLILDSKLSTLLSIILLLFGIFLVKDSLIERIRTGQTNEHWSRYLSMLFLIFQSITILSAKVINYSLQLIIHKKDFLTKKSK